MKTIGAAVFLVLAASSWASSSSVDFPALKYSDRAPGSLPGMPLLSHHEYTLPTLEKASHLSAEPSKAFNERSGIITPPTDIDYKLRIIAANPKIDPEMIKGSDARPTASANK